MYKTKRRKLHNQTNPLQLNGGNFLIVNQSGIVVEHSTTIKEATEAAKTATKIDPDLDEDDYSETMYVYEAKPILKVVAAEPVVTEIK